MNKVFLIGNLTKDPELNTTNSGLAVCKMTIAVNKGEDAQFFNIVAWRGLATSCNTYLAKGRKIAVCGRLETRSYDAQDGTKRYVTEIVAEDIEFLTSPQNSGAPSGTTPIEPDDSLPF